MEKKNNQEATAAGCVGCLFGTAALVAILVGIPALLIKLIFFM